MAGREVLSPVSLGICLAGACWAGAQLCVAQGGWKASGQ